MAETSAAPDNNLGRELYALLLTDSRAASARIALAYHESLVRDLLRAHPGESDKHLIEQGVNDALVSLLARPQQYDPEKGGLYAYLKMSAGADYKNRRKSEDRRARRHVEHDAHVADWDGNAEQPIEYPDDTSVEDEVLRKLDPLWPRLETLLPNPTDLQVLRMMMDNVRRTESYAMVLGISHLPEDEQAREVKRVKDRIRVKILRNLDPAELRHDD